MTAKRRDLSEGRFIPTEQSCPWCNKPFLPRVGGGKPQRFCSTQCRTQFHSACRAWADAQVWSGNLPMSSLKRALRHRARFSEGC